MNRISVITICFNNLPELIATCNSVNEQMSQPFEHLIIDGSSKPDIKSWLGANPQPACRRWICERDKGIADAFNKGVENAAGDIIVFLNAADLFFDPEVLQKVAIAFESYPEIIWLHGNARLMRAGEWITVGKIFERSKLYRGMRRVMHQTMFVRKAAFRKHGLFDVSLKYSMDFDFLCRIADEPFLYLQDTLAVYDTTGVSSVQYLAAMAEARMVYRRYYKGGLMLRLWGWRLGFLYHLLNTRAGKKLFRLKKAMKLENW